MQPRGPQAMAGPDEPASETPGSEGMAAGRVLKRKASAQDSDTPAPIASSPKWQLAHEVLQPGDCVRLVEGSPFAADVTRILQGFGVTRIPLARLRQVTETVTFTRNATAVK